MTFNNYKTAFEARYKVPEIMRFKWARELFSRPQGEDENVDDYVIQMQKLGKVVGINEEMLNPAILNGLKTHIANFVTQKPPRNIDELLAAARMAELTIPAPTDDSLHAKVDKLMSTWSKMTTSSVQERRSPIPQRRVTFDDNTRSQNRTPKDLVIGIRGILLDQGLFHVYRDHGKDQLNHACQILVKQGMEYINLATRFLNLFQVDKEWNR